MEESQGTTTTPPPPPPKKKDSPFHHFFFVRRYRVAVAVVAVAVVAAVVVAVVVAVVGRPRSLRLGRPVLTDEIINGRFFLMTTVMRFLPSFCFFSSFFLFVVPRWCRSVSFSRSALPGTGLAGAGTLGFVVVVVVVGVVVGFWTSEKRRPLASNHEL